MYVLPSDGFIIFHLGEGFFTEVVSFQKKKKSSNEDLLIVPRLQRSFDRAVKSFHGQLFGHICLRPSGNTVG